MVAVKGATRNTVLVNRKVWLSEVKRIASERGVTVYDLSKMVAPNRNDQYIVSLHSKNPRIAVEVVTALGDFGADVNSILKCNEEEAKEEKGNSDKLSEQLETIISLLKTIVDIWGGEKNEQSV